MKIISKILDQDKIIIGDLCKIKDNRGNDLHLVKVQYEGYKAMDYDKSQVRAYNKCLITLEGIIQKESSRY